jgi:hypothetical protein
MKKKEAKPEFCTSRRFNRKRYFHSRVRLFESQLQYRLSWLSFNDCFNSLQVSTGIVSWLGQFRCCTKPFQFSSYIQTSSEYKPLPTPRIIGLPLASQLEKRFWPLKLNYTMPSRYNRASCEVSEINKWPQLRKLPFKRRTAVVLMVIKNLEWKDSEKTLLKRHRRE